MEIQTLRQEALHARNGQLSDALLKSPPAPAVSPAPPEAHRSPAPEPRPPALNDTTETREVSFLSVHLLPGF